MGRKSSVDFNPAFSSPPRSNFHLLNFIPYFFHSLGLALQICFYSVPHKCYIIAQGPPSHPVELCLIIARAGLVNRCTTSFPNHVPLHPFHYKGRWAAVVYSHLGGRTKTRTTSSALSSYWSWKSTHAWLQTMRREEYTKRRLSDKLDRQENVWRLISELLTEKSEA